MTSKTNKTKMTRGKYAYFTKKELHKVARARAKKACKEVA